MSATQYRYEQVQPERADRSSSPFDHNASFIPLVSHSTSGLTGHEHLARAMGYRTESISPQAIRLICADALTCIEKLTRGMPLTRRPRSMHSTDVQLKLLKMVPAMYLRQQYISQERPSVIDWRYSECLALAVAEYVTDLKIQKHCGATKQTQIAEGRPSGGAGSDKKLSRHYAEITEKALERIDSWCNDWLDGKIAEEDWTRMEEVL